MYVHAERVPEKNGTRIILENRFIWVLQENIQELVPGIKLVIAC